LERYATPLPLLLHNRKILVQVIPLENHRHIIVTQDQTEEERLARTRSDFIANASHELRTPLTVIIGFLEMAETHPDMPPETRSSHIRLMREQGERMRRLVENMLLLTNLESSDYPLKRDIVPIRSLLRQIHEEALALSRGSHSISLDADEGPDTIYGSDEELRTAFGNLVSNAVRYTPAGGRIDLHWKGSDKGVRFVVSDTGVGIGAEHLPALTQRFYRVDANRGEKGRGTGLGLAIVRHILLRHKGQLLIQSTPGVGSVFTAQFGPHVLTL
jgi:two-component system phosphate regulon sensor histidine kinase PhoR